MEDWMKDNVQADVMGFLGQVDASWGVLAVALLAVAIGLVVHRLGGLVILRITRGHIIASAVARRCWRPARAALPLIALQIVWQRIAADCSADLAADARA
jgi:hypothetical protein